MRRLLLSILAALSLVSLAGCTAENVWAPDEAVRNAAYRADQPTSLTLFTMVNNRSNEGAHSALMINASQRVIFDPAGSWYHPAAPERNDLIYGVGPTLLNFYIDYHARETYRVVAQTIEVSPEVAERALQQAVAISSKGATPKAMCANATSGLLRQVPGFESMPQTYFPAKLSARFGQLPRVTTLVYRDTDSDYNTPLLVSQQSSPGSRAGQPAIEGQPIR